MTRGARTVRQAGMLGQFSDSLVGLARPLPTTVLWRWRYELLVLAGVGALAWSAFAAPLVGWLALGVLLCGTASGRVRRAALERAWCVLTTHRVRVACRGALLVSTRGRLPLVLRARPLAGAVRVELWCASGLAMTDFLAAADLIAASCFADEVLVGHRTGRNHRVVLDIVRRAANEHAREYRDRPVSAETGPLAA